MDSLDPVAIIAAIGGVIITIFTWLHGRDDARTSITFCNAMNSQAQNGFTALKTEQDLLRELIGKIDKH